MLKDFIIIENFEWHTKREKNQKKRNDIMFNGTNKKWMTFALQLNRNGHRDIFIDHIISMDEQNVALLLIYFGQQNQPHTCWKYPVSTKPLFSISWINSKQERVHCAHTQRERETERHVHRHIQQWHVMFESIERWFGFWSCCWKNIFNFIIFEAK